MAISVRAYFFILCEELTIKLWYNLAYYKNIKNKNFQLHQNISDWIFWKIKFFLSPSDVVGFAGSDKKNPNYHINY